MEILTALLDVPSSSLEAKELLLQDGIVHWFMLLFHSPKNKFFSRQGRKGFL